MSNYKDYGFYENTASHTFNYLIEPIEYIIKKNKSEKLLDIGCGNGFIANYLIKKGYDVYGTDASESGINIANSVNPDRFFIQDLSTNHLPKNLENQQFDTIISTEVIEHLYNPRQYVSFCKSVLMKNGGGSLVISTPYHGYLKNNVLAITGKLDSHLTALWDGGHIKFWSKKTLTILLQEQGFHIVEFIGCGRWPFLWKSMIIHAKI